MMPGETSGERVQFMKAGAGPGGQQEKGFVVKPLWEGDALAVVAL